MIMQATGIRGEVQTVRSGPPLTLISTTSNIKMETEIGLMDVANKKSLDEFIKEYLPQK